MFYIVIRFWLCAIDHNKEKSVNKNELLFLTAVLTVASSVIVLLAVFGRRRIRSVRLVLLDTLVVVGTVSYFRVRYPDIAPIVGSMTLFGMTVYLAVKHLGRADPYQEGVKMIRLRHPDGSPVSHLG